MRPAEPGVPALPPTALCGPASAAQYRGEVHDHDNADENAEGNDYFFASLLIHDIARLVFKRTEHEGVWTYRMKDGWEVDLYFVSRLFVISCCARVAHVTDHFTFGQSLRSCRDAMPRIVRATQSRVKSGPISLSK